MKQQIIPRSLGTHNGSFHADEVTACSLLLLFDQIDRDQIHRTRDTTVLSCCDYVCDVGGQYSPADRRFDHHQAEYVGLLSSAGMILAYLRDQEVISLSLYEYFNDHLILGIDAHDNGRSHIERGVCSFSLVVSNFLPISYEVSSEWMNRAFFQAVDFVVGHLERLAERWAYIGQCKEVVEKKMKGAERVLVFEEAIPWMDAFFDLGGEHHPAQFIVMPAGNHWKLRGIPPSLEDRMKVRCPLPENWGGLQGDDLRRVSGISGAIFCHKGRFISIWQTRKDALLALEFVLSQPT